MILTRYVDIYVGGQPDDFHFWSEKWLPKKVAGIRRFRVVIEIPDDVDATLPAAVTETTPGEAVGDK